MSAIKGLSVFLLAILTFLSFDAEAAFAHTPHDIISEVEISPNYDQDQTLFIGGAKSEDGGKSWKIIVKDLNNKYKLSSLYSSA